MHKKKVLIVISSDLFIRNYLLTDALSEIEGQYNTHYVSNKNTTILNELTKKKGFEGFYEIDNNMQKRHQRIFDVLMWKYRRKSSSFLFRVMRGAPDFHRVIVGPKKRMHLRFLKWLVVKPYLLIQRMFLNIDQLSKWYIKKLTNSVRVNVDLRSYIEQNSYDLVIFPSSAYDVEGIDIACICEENNIKSLFLIDNWDNLSSKSIMWKKPNYLGVWGQQSKQHAVEIQDFEEKNITLLGTPRFDNYFEVRGLEIDSHFDYRYILFVGTALDFDEEGLLFLIDEIVENNKKIWGDIKIIYRPHPWRQNNCEVKSSYGVNIITDPQLLAANNDKSLKTQPELEYYSGLLKNAEYVMGGLTTMLIESLIFHKPFLAFVHHDNKYISNMRNAWNFFEHFKGLDNVEAMTFSYDEQDIEQKMVECWCKRELLDCHEIDKDRAWYLFDDGRKYNDRLLSCVDNIID